MFVSAGLGHVIIWEFAFRFYKGRVSKRAEKKDFYELLGVARDADQNHQASF